MTKIFFLDDDEVVDISTMACYLQNPNDCLFVSDVNAVSNIVVNNSELILVMFKETLPSLLEKLDEDLNNREFVKHKCFLRASVTKLVLLHKKNEVTNDLVSESIKLLKKNNVSILNYPVDKKFRYIDFYNFINSL